MTAGGGRLPADELPSEQLALLAGPLSTLASSTGRGVSVLSATRLRRGVHRLHLHGATRPTVVVKRLAARVARLEEQVTGRWLPAVGLDGLGPPRRASVGEPDGRHVWHVYDDLGAWGLDREDVDPPAWRRRWTGSRTSMQPSRPRHARGPRFAAGDLGVYFYVNSVRDAARRVARLRPPAVQVSPEEAQARDAVEGHLARLLADEPRAGRAPEEQAGPETVVHGDLTRANVFVPPALGGRGAPGQRVRPIDWDHVGVAPAGFDISTTSPLPQGPAGSVLDGTRGRWPSEDSRSRETPTGTSWSRRSRRVGSPTR